jgi:hypothetical protein
VNGSKKKKLKNMLKLNYEKREGVMNGDGKWRK